MPCPKSPALNFTRILLKLSGEILQGEKGFGVDDAEVQRIAQEIVTLNNEGISIGIVIGGGNFFRGASEAGQKMQRTSADLIGMLATLQNAIILADKINQLNAKAEIFTAHYVQGVGKLFTPEEAEIALAAGKITILAGGTGNPFFTTDTAAILRALEIHADIVLKGTKVDGVYDKDPEKYPDARLIKSLSYDEYIKRNLRVMDLTAISLAKEHKLPIKIFNIKARQNIHKAVYKEDVGSIIK